MNVWKKTVAILIITGFAGTTTVWADEPPQIPKPTAFGSFADAMKQGHLLRAKGKHAEALVAFEEARALAETDAEKSRAHYMVGHGCAALKKPDDALKAWQEISKLKTPDPKILYLAHMQMGWCLLRKGPKASLPMFETALKLAPDGPSRAHALENVAWRMLEMKQTGKALVLWEKVANMEDGGAAARSRSCQAYVWNCVDRRKAISMLQKAIELHGLSADDTAGCWFGIADNYKILKEYDKAKSTLAAFKKSKDFRKKDKSQFNKVMKELDALMTK